MNKQERDKIHKYLNDLTDKGLPQMWNDTIRIYINSLTTEDECICIGDVCLCGKGSDFGGRVNLNTHTTEDEPNTCESCGNAVGLWCDRWDGQTHDNQTCNEWSKIHWCSTQEDNDN